MYVMTVNMGVWCVRVGEGRGWEEGGWKAWCNNSKMWPL